MPSRIDILDAYRELMGSSVLDFARKMFPYMNGGADYIVADFHRKICEKLDAVVRGECNRLIINVPPRYGKCVHPDTRIYTERGLVAAKDIKAGDMLYSYLDGRVVVRRCAATSEAYKDSVKITMRSGRTFTCSEDHPMLTPFGYVEAGKLKPKDRIQAIRARIDSPNEIDDYELKFITMMIFDGYCGKSPQFVKDDPVAVSEMKSCCDALGFGMTKIKNRCGYSITGGRTSRVHDLLRKYGIENHLAYDKRVPADWFALSLRQKLLFIDLMFATDGYAQGNGQSGIALANRGLIDDIQHILSTIGIISTISYKKNDKACAWVLSIPRSETVKLLGMITFYQKRKMAERALQKTPVCITDTFPYEIIQRERMTYKVKHPPFRCSEKKEITREKFVRLSEQFECLKKYICEDFYLDRVENIEPVGEMKLIDIEVEETHNFIGNGLVSHNTQLVSQLFCAYSFAVNPASKILHLSYSAGLTMENSMAVKEMVESDFFRALFPARINPKRNWRNKWDTMQKGGFYATSTLGQITGFGAGQLDPRDAGREEELLDEYTTVGGEGYSGAIVIDDPIKPEEALSERVRETVNRRFETTIRNRVNSKRTPIIIIMQRLHEHDLCGYLMDVEPGKWEVLSLPAIQHDENGDEKALWDFKHTLEELHALREINQWVFDTQYDQNPKPIEGLLFPEKETKYMEKIPEEYELCFIQIDPADEGTNKYCSRVFLVREGYLYNVETIYTEKELEETLPRQKEQILRWHPSYVNAESNSAWRLVAKDLKEWAEGLSLDCDIHRFNARTNKEVRVFNEAPTIRHRFYYLPPSMQDAEYRQSMKDKHSYLKMVKDQDDDSVDCDAAASSWAKKMGLIPLI